MKHLLVKSPTRMDIAGGFLDIWPVHTLIENCMTVNYSLPIFTSAKWELIKKQPSHPPRLKNSKILIEVSFPTKKNTYTFSHIEDLLATKDQNLSLLQVHLQYWLKERKSLIHKMAPITWSLSLSSQSPKGAGLGASSSLCMSLLKLFSQILHKPFNNDYEQLWVCRDLETTLLHAPAGTQDYISAFRSEPHLLYMISYLKGHVYWQIKKIPPIFLQDHILLVDTGISHHSGHNNWKILKKIIEKDSKLLDGLKKLRDHALHTVKVCEQEDWSKWENILKTEWELRKQLFTGWTNQAVLALYDSLIESGARAVKLCGAGGGGAAIVFAKNKKQKESLKQACIKKQIPIIWCF